MAFHADDTAQPTTPAEENAAPVFHPHRNYFCRACGYDLRHLERSTCPECGRAFDPGDYRTYDTARRGPVGRGLRDLEAVYDKFGPWWDSLSPKRRTVILLAGMGCVALILARSLETAPLLIAVGVVVMLLLQIRSPTRPSPVGWASRPPSTRRVEHCAYATSRDREGAVCHALTVFGKVCRDAARRSAIEAPARRIVHR